MKKDIYSKKNLEGLANELLAYLYSVDSYRVEEFGMDEKLSDDVMIYTLGNLYFVSVEKKLYEFEGAPIAVKEGVEVEDYVPYCNKKTLTMVMDSVLSEYLYAYDVPGCEEVAKKVDAIFEKHGFFTEFGDGITMFAWTREDYPEF